MQILTNCMKNRYTIDYLSMFYCHSYFDHSLSTDMTCEQALNEGQNLLDQLSLPVKDSSGKDISPDHTKDSEHVERVMEDLQARKLRCDELADVRRLKLQQILQLRTCERDAEQVQRTRNINDLECRILEVTLLSTCVSNYQST